jgi:hypothetical protein
MRNIMLKSASKRDKLENIDKMDILKESTTRNNSAKADDNSKEKFSDDDDEEKRKRNAASSVYEMFKYKCFTTCESTSMHAVYIYNFYHFYFKVNF